MNDINLNEIGQRIRERRVQLGLSQEQKKEKSQLSLVSFNL